MSTQAHHVFFLISIVLMLSLAPIYMMIPHDEIDPWFYLNTCPVQAVVNANSDVNLELDKNEVEDFFVPVSDVEVVRTFLGVRLPQLERCPTVFNERHATKQVFGLEKNWFRQDVIYNPVVFRNNEAIVDISFSVYNGDNLMFAVKDLKFDTLQKSEIDIANADTKMEQEYELYEEAKAEGDEDDIDFIAMNQRKLMKGGYSRSSTTVYRTRWGRGSRRGEVNPIRKKHGWSAYEAVPMGTQITAHHVGPSLHDATNCLTGCAHLLVHDMVREELSEFAISIPSTEYLGALRLEVDHVTVMQNRSYGVENEYSLFGFVSNQKRGLIPRPEVYITFATREQSPMNSLWSGTFYWALAAAVLGTFCWLLSVLSQRINFKRLHRNYVIRKVHRMPFPTYRILTGETTLNLRNGDYTTTQHLVPGSQSHLDLYSNDLNTLSGLTRFDSLERLNLSDNDLTSLSGIGSHNNLLWLDVTNNDIYGTFQLPTQRALEWLNLSSNNIEGFGDNFSETLPNLLYLNCSDNDIERLNLYCSKKTPASLLWIDASNNDINDISLHNFGLLTHIDLSSNSLEEAGNLYECYSLEYINLSNNKIIEIDESILNLSLCPNLRILDLSRNTLNEDAREELRHFFRSNDRDPDRIIIF